MRLVETLGIGSNQWKNVFLSCNHESVAFMRSKHRAIESLLSSDSQLESRV